MLLRARHPRAVKPLVQMAWHPNRGHRAAVDVGRVQDDKVGAVL